MTFASGNPSGSSPNESAPASLSQKYLSAFFKVEGGDDPPEHTFGTIRSTPLNLSAGTPIAPLMSIRPSATFNSQYNRSIIIPKYANFGVEGGRCFVRAVFNPSTLTGATWAAAVPTNSSVQVDTAATALTGGIAVGVDFSQDVNGKGFIPFEQMFGRFLRKLVQQAFGAGLDVLTLEGNRLSSNPSVTGALMWGEIR